MVHPDRNRQGQGLLGLVPDDRVVATVQEEVEAIEVALRITGRPVVIVADDADGLDNERSAAGRLAELPPHISFLASAEVSIIDGPSNGIDFLASSGDLLILKPPYKWHFAISRHLPIERSETERLVGRDLSEGRGILRLDGEVIAPVQVPYD